MTVPLASDPDAATDAMKRLRAIMTMPAMRPYVLAEHWPGPAVQSDAEILQYCREVGSTISVVIAYGWKIFSDTEAHNIDIGIRASQYVPGSG